MENDRLPLVTLKEGCLYVDGSPIRCITDLNLNSSVQGPTEVNVTFLAEIDGFDNYNKKCIFEDKNE